MIRRYEKSDFNSISTWSGVPLNILPTVGLIEPDVAVGFLVQTDTNYCFLEPFIANKARPKEERNVAIYAIADGLLAEAKHRGFDMVFCILSHPRMIERAHDLGFVNVVGQQHLLGRKL